MRRLLLTEDLKGKTIKDIFFNDKDWVIVFSDETSINLKIIETRRKAVCYISADKVVYSMEIETDEM